MTTPEETGDGGGSTTCEPWSTRTAHTAHEDTRHNRHRGVCGPASRGAHGRRTRLTRRKDTRHNRHRGVWQRLAFLLNMCQTVLNQSSHILVSLKGSVSPMRETPRATGSIASDCFSETRVAQKAADCQPAKPSSLSRLALGVALSPGAYHGTASSHAPHGRKTHSHTQSVCG